MTKVRNFDLANKKLMLVLTESLKGKPKFEQVPVSMLSDIILARSSEKIVNEEQRKHILQDFEKALLERLDENLPLMLFITHSNRNNSNQFTVKAYTNGTWFSLEGENNDNEVGIWKLTVAEPYLRKLYTGPTEELRNLIVDREAGKIKKLPE